MPFYAIARGRIPGIYTSWDKAKKQVIGFNGAKFKKFETEIEAQQFVQENAQQSFSTTNIEKAFGSAFKKENPIETDNNLIVFTDGACTNNGKKNARASFAAAYPFHPEWNYAAEIFEEKKSNNVGEFTALIYTLKHCNIVDQEFKKTLIVYTDSMLLVNTVNKWMTNWKKNGWKKADGTEISNLELVQTIDELLEKRKCAIKYTKAHSGESTWEAINNDIADKLAQAVLH